MVGPTTEAPTNRMPAQVESKRTAALAVQAPASGLTTSLGACLAERLAACLAIARLLLLAFFPLPDTDTLPLKTHTIYIKQ
jgi:hypothetical protein